MLIKIFTLLLFSMLSLQVSAIDNIATFLSSETTNSTDLNQDTAYPFKWMYDSFDNNVYQHDVTSYAHEIYVKQDGNYFVSFSMPVSVAAYSRESVRVEIRVNGSVIPYIRGESGYIRDYDDHKESSIQFSSLLIGLHANDKIEVYTQRGGDSGKVTTAGAELYLEKMSTGESLFFAKSTATINSTNLNQSTAYGMKWQEQIKSSDYTHSDTSNPNEITFATAGDYLVFFNAPLFANFDCSADNNQRVSVQAQFKLNGSNISGGLASQGYIRCYKATHSYSSIHWFALLPGVNVGDKLTIDLQGETNRIDGSYPVIVPTSREASLLIQKYDTSSKVLSMRATELISGSNWNDTNGSDVKWAVEDKIDAAIYGHSTSTNPNEITVKEDGDYLVIYSHAHSSSVVRASVDVRVKVNNSVKDGGQCNTGYIRNNNSHTQSSCSLTFLLEKLRAGDKITLTAAQEAQSGTVNLIGDARITIIQKGQTSSTFDINNIPNKILHLDASQFDSVIDSGGRTANDPSFNISEVQKWKDVSNSTNIHNAYQDTATNQPDFNVVNKQITFDGSDDYFKIDDNDDMNTKSITPEKTIAIVFRTGSDVDTTQLVYEEGGTVRGMNVYISEGKLYIAMWNDRDDGDGTQAFTYSSTAITADTNYYATLVIDYSNYTGPDGPDGELRGHINGVKFTNIGTTTSRLFSHPGDIGIGAKVNDTYYHTGKSSGTGDYFQGDIFELIVYNKAIDDNLAVDFYNYFKQKWPDPYPVTGVKLTSSYTNSSSETPVVNWTASNTPDVDHYEMAVGTSTGDSDVANWSSVGNVTSASLSSLTLNECTNYYASVRTVDSSAEISTAVSTDWFKYDGTAPTSPTSLTISGSSSTSTSKQLDWNASSDNCGFDHYMLAIGSSAGATDIVGWTDIGNVVTYQFTNLSLSSGTDYFFSIKGVDGAGNESTPVNSAAWQVDTCVASDSTAPTTPGVPSIAGAAGTTTSPQHAWSASTDECGFSHYEIAIGTTSGGNEAVDWTDIGDVTSYKMFNISPSLHTNTDYYTSIRAVDLAGNISTVATSSAWKLEPPGGVDPTGLELWLDADDTATIYTDSSCSSAVTGDGQSVGCWQDKSGLGNNATASNMPLYKENQLNGKAVLRFDGVDDSVDFPELTNVRTFFIVNRSASSTWQPLAGHSSSSDFYTNDNTLLGSSASSYLLNGAWKVNMADVSDPQNYTQSGQYSIISVVTTGNVRIDHLSSDQKQSDRFFAGDIVEVIAYSRALSSSEVYDVEHYLNDKWLDPNPASVTNLTLSSQYTQNNSETPVVTWIQSSSPDIDHYEVALGTSAGANDVAGWIDIGLVDNYKFNSLNLASCTDYFFSIKSVDVDGYESAVISTEFIRFDNTPPDNLTGLSLSETATATTSKKLTWASGSDSCSAVHYKVALGTSSGSSDIIEWTDTSFNYHQFSSISPDLSSATDYYMSVKAIDEAGNESAISSSLSWQIDDACSSDTTNPTDPSNLLLSSDATLTTSKVLAWTGSSDNCSLDHYEIALGTTSGGTDVVDWLNIGNVTTYQFTNLSPYLAYDTDYYLSIKAVDATGNSSGIVTSSAFRLKTPGGVSAAGLTVWIDSSRSTSVFQDSDCTTAVNSDNQNVGCVKDLSGYDHHAKSSNSSEQPTYRSTSFNGSSALYFDGAANEFLDFGQQTDIRTVFWVLREDSSNPGTLPFLLGDPNGSTYDFFAGSNSIFDTNNAASAVLNGTLHLNGGVIDGTVTARPTIATVLSLVTTGNVTASAFSRDRVNTAGDRTWGGELAELLIYNRALSSSEIEAVETDLKDKWGISSSETIWNGSVDNDWFNANNWSNGVPTNLKDCTINGTVVAEITGGQTAKCRHISVGTGTIALDSGNSSGLEIWGNMTVDSSGLITKTDSTTGNDYAITFVDSGTETGNNEITINSSTLSNLGNVSFTKTAGDTISFVGSFAANSWDIPSGDNFSLILEKDTQITLNGNFTQSSGNVSILSGVSIAIIDGGSFNIAGGSFSISGAADAYPQDMTTKVKISAQGSGTWGFTATAGSLSLEGFWFDKLNSSGLNLQGASNITKLSGGQFTYLPKDYSTPVAAITLNTSAQLSVSVAYDIGFYWGDQNNDDDDISDAPGASDNYYLVKAADCGGGNLYFDQWHGDFYNGDPSFDTEGKILDSDDDSANDCQVSIDIAASPVNITSFTATPYKQSVLLEWTTSDELHHKGFNLYRSDNPLDGYKQINNELIRNFISSTSFRGKYRFSDLNLTNGKEYFYMIEDIANDGTSELHGPISAIPDGTDTIPAASSDENTTVAPSTTEDFGNGVMVLARTLHSMRIKITPSNLNVTTSDWDNDHKKVDIVGYMKMGESGYPELLSRTILIPIEQYFTTLEKTEVSLVTSDHSADLSSTPVVPAPAWEVDNTTEQLQPVWSENSVAYAASTSFPSQFYRVEEQPREIAGKLYLAITVWPLQYVATSNSLTKLDELILDIGIDGQIWASPAPSDLQVEAPTITEGNVRVEIDHAGFYEISFTDLVDNIAAATLENSPIDTLRLYYHGRELPLEIISSDEFLNSGDVIRFHAPFSTSNEENHDYLILTDHDYIDTDNNEDYSDLYRFFTFDNQQSLNQSGVKNNYLLTKIYEQNLMEMFDNPIGGDADRFYWQRIVAPAVSGTFDNLSITANFDNLDVNAEDLIKIKVYLKGHSANTTNPIHHLKLYVDDVFMRDTVFQEQEPSVQQFSLLASDLSPGDHTLKLEVVGDKVSSGDYDIVDLNKVIITYPSLLIANNGQIEISGVLPDEQLEVGGFSSGNVNVYDISDPRDGARYNNLIVESFDGGTTYQVSFDAQKGNLGYGGYHYWLVEDGHFDTPLSVSLTTGYASNLKSLENQFDYIIIGHPNLLMAISDLSSLRKTQGLRVLEVTYQQIYDSFSYGQVSSQAIKDFILYAYQHWSQRPSYLLLLGEPSYDPQNILGYSTEDNLIPIPLVKGINTDFGSAAWFATPIGQQAPVVAIGWLPSSNPVVLQNYANKVIGYEMGDYSPLNDQAKEAILIAGQDTHYEKFDQKISKLATALTTAQPDYTTETVVRSTETDAEFKTSIISSFDQAPLILSYLGHGSEEMWEGYDVFAVDDVATLTNNRLPIVEALNCLNGYFYDADTAWKTLGEELVFKKEGGSIAFWGSTTMTAPNAQMNLATSLFTQLAQNTNNGVKLVRLGDLTLQAKSVQSTDHMAQDIVKSFVLIGDPALKLPVNSFSPAKSHVVAPSASSGGGGCSAFGSSGTETVSIWIQLFYFLFEVAIFMVIYLITRWIRIKL